MMCKLDPPLIGALLKICLCQLLNKKTCSCVRPSWKNCLSYLSYRTTRQESCQGKIARRYMQGCTYMDMAEISLLSASSPYSVLLQERLLECLHSVQNSLTKEICDLKDRQALTEENVGQLQLQQLTLHNQYVSTVQDVEKIKSEVARIATNSEEIPYVFNGPTQNPWFTGRSSEIQDLARLLRIDDEITSKPEVHVAAVCGLGGVGKTSLGIEYAQQRKDFYTGGVYWFSGEDDTKFENSVYDVAMGLGSFQSGSFALTFSATLSKISRNKNPWLIILDNMDQRELSANIVKLITGSWRYGASGHLLITTRRKPNALSKDIRHFDERCCLRLKCFEIEEGKKFLFRRIGIRQNEDTDVAAETLVGQLGGLPLALEQAGAYIKSLPCTLSQYLELYDLQRLRLLNRQKATPASEYESVDSERLAVRTTWHLNFEHIKQTVDDGKAATIFLNACAFLNPNEIEQDLINIGEPPVEDDEFSQCVKTTLGSQQILKLLTDFSLFKQSVSSNLSVHHLVQEVIQDNLNEEEKIEAVIHAIRMLRFAFVNCSSPDELLSSFSSERHERPSIASVEQSRFYKWHRLCSHSYELVKHLKAIVKESDGNRAKIFLPETARIVYECAIHLSANSKQNEAKEVANFAREILHLSNHQVPAEQSSIVFPHLIPLPELVRRHIQYSCKTPATNAQGGHSDNEAMPLHSVTSEQLKELRMKGNDLFKKGFYNDALKVYTDAIEKSRNTDLFDVTLFSNRASVYLKLKQYDAALQDADAYIFQRPKCWKGYARKALALVDMGDVHGASVAAGLAYYYERNVFRDFEPFRRKFDFFQSMRMTVCRNNSDFSKRFLVTRGHSFVNRVLGVDDYEDFQVILLEPNDYLVSLHTIDPRLFSHDGQLLPIDALCLVGTSGECRVTFDDNLSVKLCKILVAHNVTFRSRHNFHFEPGSVVKLSHCSFESTEDVFTSFCCKGELKVHSCKFHDCTKGGLLVVGDAEVENSEFYGNGAAGLEVRDGGRLVVRNSKMYANKQGLLIGPKVKECVVDDCELYDNKWGGIVVANCTSSVTIKGNRIYDNDEPGITVMDASKAVCICENEIFKNRHWGTHISDLSQAVVKKNKIHNNVYGGVLLNALHYKSVVEYNEIFSNSGPGIHEVGVQTMDRWIGNKLDDNKEKRNQSTAQSEAKLCYYCMKPGKNLKKCGKCYTAQYCDQNCQKQHWKDHKEVCNRYLSDASILLKYKVLPIIEHHSPSSLHDYRYHGIRGERAPGLLPLGSKYCPPPNATQRFIVKISAGVPFDQTEEDCSVVQLYDRSLTIDGHLTGAEQIYHLVEQYGSMGQLYNNWKKLFMWAKGPEDGKLRVFINEFPPYQNW